MCLSKGVYCRTANVRICVALSTSSSRLLSVMTFEGSAFTVHVAPPSLVVQTRPPWAITPCGAMVELQMDVPATQPWRESTNLTPVLTEVGLQSGGGSIGTGGG